MVASMVATEHRITKKHATIFYLKHILNINLSFNISETILEKKEEDKNIFIQFR